MTDKKVECQKPQNMKDENGNCSPEQIKICHGSESCHPCEKPSDR